MATRIPQEFIDEVTSKTNIVDVISKYVQLKKSGKNLFGLCPFHEERTPSFSVAEDKQIFHCFSCGRGGNVFKFIMEMENKSFPEAVIEVAQMGNIPVPDQYEAKNNQYQNSDSQTLLKMYADAAKLYSHILLKTENGSNALKYLRNRQLDDDLIQTFGIGYAPNNNNLLLQFFKDRDISEDILRKSGLFAQNQEGELFDRFRDRVMIPITDESGNIIAFSGRILDKEASTAKYLNSPETEIFNKSKTLFNLNNAKKEIREKSNVILFEGFMDVISAYKAGVTNGVASMGTSLTDQQLYVLSRLTNQINICYDGDDPGVEATYRALTQLTDERFTYGVISIPDKKDPDEFIKSEGSEKFQNLANSVQTPISFILNYFKRNYNLNNEHDQLEFLDRSLKEIVKLQSPVEVDMYVGKVADEMNVSKDAINKELDTLRRQISIQKPANNYKDVQQHALEKVTSSVRPKYDRLEKSERYLLYWAINFPEIRINLKGDGFKFVHQNYQRIFDSLLSYAEQNDAAEEINISDFMNVLDNDDKNLLAELEMMNMPVEYNDQEIDDYMNNIKNSGLESQLSDINQQLKKAAMVGDNKLQLELTQQLIKVRRILSN
ncbi:DNA primase [Companilactobacillus pabuli]|jgi:DNA primase, catalytic core|uniref:DNA primase n=1 Tax=Companilactobacillus pabuli TaxID=2714036 RepID=A0A7L7KX95_9LACO|nr:DNA primase [Companilactobacillus pabuli]AKP03865.1 DNA primase [Companilactobacillus farciminis]AKS52170.1 DNA primase [Companilactobacillus farciminis]MDG5113098.1 DNA primase [Companilactobacillus pabuli]QMT84079.1 DNA primase [Companilactobacillus pabuli]GAQ01987.1 DNA primase [Companilactobacillus farciminis]